MRFVRGKAGSSHEPRCNWRVVLRRSDLFARASPTMPRIATFLTFALIVCAGATAAAQTRTCACQGKLIRNKAISGGDSRPLTWDFSVSLQEPASTDKRQILCYLRNVFNHSTEDDVHDVSWKVAYYERSLIPARTPQTSCLPLGGEVKSVPTPGPLTYGVSFQPYDTSVWPPEEGWLPKKAEATTSNPLQKSFDPLQSEIAFAYRTKDGELRASQVAISSGADFDQEKKIGTLRLGIINGGKYPVSLFPNFPGATKYFSPERQFPANKEIDYEIPIGEPPVFRPTTILFYGDAGQVVAMDLAGLYVPANGVTKFSDEELWKTR